MAKLAIKNTQGNDAGSLVVSDYVFAAESNPACVRIALNNYRANQRSGTHSTKTRGFVSGGGKKPWKQKHTGRARQGSIRAVQWRGGAIAFGPHPRDYSYRINRQVKQNAFRTLWSDLVREGRLIVLDSWNLDEPKTKRVTEILKGLGASGKVLILTAPDQTNLMLSARNIPNVTLASVESPNVFELAHAEYVVTTGDLIKKIEGGLAEE